MPTRWYELGLSADELSSGRLKAKLPHGTVAWTPLQYACAVGDKELVSEILAENPEAIKDLGNVRCGKKSYPGFKSPLTTRYARTSYVDSPLHIAVRFDHEALVKLLLDASSPSTQVNAVDNQIGCTPLHLAILQGNPTIVKLLLGNASIQQLKSKNGTTPLELATKLELSDMQALLLDHAIRVAGHNQLCSWLASIGLIQYAPMFVNEGFDDAPLLLATGGLDDKALDAMRIPKAGHRAKFQRRYQLKEFLKEESVKIATEGEASSSSEDDSERDECVGSGDSGSDRS